MRRNGAPRPRWRRWLRRPASLRPRHRDRCAVAGPDNHGEPRRHLGRTRKLTVTALEPASDSKADEVEEREGCGKGGKGAGEGGGGSQSGRRWTFVFNFRVTTRPSKVQAEDTGTGKGVRRNSWHASGSGAQDELRHIAPQHRGTPTPRSRTLWPQQQSTMMIDCRAVQWHWMTMIG
jgi:hypothetical protein